MNKTAIKNFAVWARNKLIADITYKAGLIGVSEKGVAQPLPQSSKDLQFFDIGTKEYAKIEGKTTIAQRKALIDRIKSKETEMGYDRAYNVVIEEIAYTWFNRLIAIRFMEVNDYLPTRSRMLSSENPAKNEPDFVTDPFDTDVEFSDDEVQKIYRLKDDASKEASDELFRMLFIKLCNNLYEILPELFEKTDDYTEPLLSLSFADKDGIVYHLVHDIAEDDFNVKKEGQVEIIGWMYQYYNTEPKNETFALLKKNVKITRERIPAATQLFTPDWIVRYMVENSLGRLWVEGHPSDSLKENWKYYLEEAEQEASVQEQLEQIRAEYRNLNPEEIKVIDPCMGSGHVLVYCFDVLMQIYESQGYTQRDAAQSILQNNLFGLDIDKRAAQLSYFAVMMKARQYDRRIFSREIKPHVYDIIESNEIDLFTAEYFANGDEKLKTAIDSIIREMHDAREYGSILNITPVDFSALYARFDEVQEEIHFSRETVRRELLPLVQVAEVMAQKYDVVVTNPPYMGSSGMNAKLNDFVKENYPDTKADMSTVFMEKTISMCKPIGFMAMINIPVWMFISSFEKLRSTILTGNRISTMVHPGRGIFGSDFGSTAFVIAKKRVRNYKGTYLRLFAHQGDVETQEVREQAFLARTGLNYANQDEFLKIPGQPIAYWLKNIGIFDFPSLGEYIDARIGMVSGDNERFLRLWYEVSNANIEYNAKPLNDPMQKKWYPLQKGGDFRKWYGNISYVVNWANDGYELKFDNYMGKRVRSHNYNGVQQFKEGITWNSISASKFHCRYSPIGFTYDAAGPLCEVPNRDYLWTVLGFLSTKVAEYIFTIINPTINFPSGYLEALPLKIADKEKIDKLVLECVKASRAEWNSFETTWEFSKHPLVPFAYEKAEQESSQFSKSRMEKFGRIAWHFENWERECESRFNLIKANEEELNRIFIDIYGLQGELTPEVDNRDVTVRKADLGREIRSLISYAVGCMFGRYSLDEPGLVYAGGDWDADEYSTFIPDKDNCIPITDEEYFEDDLVGQFVGWMKKAFGEENLEGNLDFIANALGNKGTTSREVIRNYFLNDFFKDHCASYSVTGSGKRPIYWLFDSGKQNGFKALVYMHRWNADTVGNLRVEYLHKMQHTYEHEIIRMQETIDNSRDSREVSKATKRKDKLQKQLKETKDYDAKLAHIALSRIEIDLDDGVKVNYEKVQTSRDGKKMQILAKI